MTQRLNGPVKKLVVLTGPVAIGVFEDGTFLVAGLNDSPVLLRHGGLMEPVEYPMTGDLEFRFLQAEGGSHD